MVYGDRAVGYPRTEISKVTAFYSGTSSCRLTLHARRYISIETTEPDLATEVLEMIALEKPLEDCLPTSRVQWRSSRQQQAAEGQIVNVHM